MEITVAKSIIVRKTKHGESCLNVDIHKGILKLTIYKIKPELL